MKVTTICIICISIFASCINKKVASKTNTHSIPKGIRAFIDDSLYTFSLDYASLATEIFPDSFSLLYRKRDTLYYFEVGGIINNNSQNYSKIRASVGFKHHEVAPGIYFHNYFGKDDTLSGITYSTQCYDYYMPNELNSNYNLTIISIDSASAQGTFIAEVNALWYEAPYNYRYIKDSTIQCKGKFRPKEKLIIRGEFNVPVKKQMIIHKRNEPHD